MQATITKLTGIVGHNIRQLLLIFQKPEVNDLQDRNETKKYLYQEVLILSVHHQGFGN